MQRKKKYHKETSIHNRDNTFTLGNPNLGENPTSFLHINYSLARFINQYFCLEICSSTQVKMLDNLVKLQQVKTIQTIKNR